MIEKQNPALEEAVAAVKARPMTEAEFAARRAALNRLNQEAEDRVKRAFRGADEAERQEAEDRVKRAFR